MKQDIIWLKKEIQKLEEINKARGHCSRTFHQIKKFKEALENS